ncbi:DUF1444 family protein [Ammoniphilus sp. CFH 90114]|uniref:DUF1444 family protein n=1 Tax=Ammoniphilus sp. CFH 90114 TaxID=2493665 RepID=UPI0013E90781|nr:DUF1444 family protein [Ammoniphilus sp. CFH 90114]
MDKNEASSFLLRELQKSLDSDLWSVRVQEDHLLVEQKKAGGSGFNLSLNNILRKMESGKEQVHLEEVLRKVLEMTSASLQDKLIKGNEKNVFPVLRSAAHPQEKQGISLLNQEHTAESRIFYCLDLGKTYVLIDRQMLQESGYEEQDIYRIALANLKSLDTTFKKDEVGGNHFYFFSPQDGYAASRILNDELMAFMKRKVTGEMGVAIPHQDVLIVADIRNDTGFKVLARINMDFCVKGEIPISPLPFLYTEEQTLEPIMVMANPGAAPNVIRKKGE